MAERKCHTCGETFRKGRRVSVLLPTGELAGALVCIACADRALRIVAPLPNAASTVRERIIPNATLALIRTRLQSFRLPYAEGVVVEADSYASGRVSGIDRAIALIDAVQQGWSI
jgi:hypothetical protein